MWGAEARKKRLIRNTKYNIVQRNKNAALGRAGRASPPANYVNPVTLNALPRGVVIYKLVNRGTGRVNYYPTNVISKLSGGKNNYAILIADPKRPLFRNPTTRGNVFPRDLTRVVIATRSKSKSKSKSRSK
jgi:hypothetical protein